MFSWSKLSELNTNRMGMSVQKTERTEVACMITLTWSSRHFRGAASCAALRQPLVCGLNLRPSLYMSQPSLVIG